MAESDRSGELDVVVPSYRRPAWLERCLAALVQQSVPPAGVVVVVRDDDAESREVALAFTDRLPGLRVVEVAEPGVIAAMSAGIAATTAPIVAFTDDDAAPHPDWIARLLGHFADPAVGAVGGRDVIVGQAPTTPEVGVYRRSGRLIGNHHTGVGPARAVDVLKGVNMAFRVEALAMPVPGLLRGRGAQVDFEVLCCAYARRGGWRIVYDPEVVVDHDPAPRVGEPRGNPEGHQSVCDEAFNHVVAACALPGLRRWRVAAYGLLVGSHDRPGAVRAVVALGRAERGVVPRLLPSTRGRLQAVRQVVGAVRRAEDPVVSAAALRARAPRATSAAG